MLIKITIRLLNYSNFNQEIEQHKQPTCNMKNYNSKKQILNLQSSKRFYSLPKKTQPTSYSSGKTKDMHHSTAKIQYYQVATCPEVQQVQISHFQPDILKKSKSRQKNLGDLYTHKLLLDYGRLQKPNFSLQNQLLKEIQLSNGLSQFLKTKKLKNLKFSAKQNYESNINLQKYHKLGQKKIKLTQKLNPKSSNKIQTKNKILKINVRAYDYFNQTFNNKNPKKQQFNTKENFMQKVQKSFIHKANKKQIEENMKKSRISQQSSRTHTQNQFSQKKILHSRIVKTINPTSGIQTKIINYPDSSDLKWIKKIK